MLSETKDPSRNHLPSARHFPEVDNQDQRLATLPVHVACSQNMIFKGLQYGEVSLLISIAGITIVIHAVICPHIGKDLLCTGNNNKLVHVQLYEPGNLCITYHECTEIRRKCPAACPLCTNMTSERVVFFLQRGALEMVISPLLY